jgi:2-phosphosulfolactate phosphatase
VGCGRGHQRAASSWACRAVPEAEVAAAAYTAVEDRPPASLRACASGRKLIEKNFAEDVKMASEFDVSECVPLLSRGVFMSAGG